VSTSAEEVSGRYLHFARDECHGYSPLYEHLALAVAEDPLLRGFVAEQPDPQPNLFFAAVQHLTGPEHMPADGLALTAFVRRNGDPIRALMRSRHTQTNEVGRCGALLLAMPEGPLALLELGSSAGLCLLLDRYRYDFGGVHVGDPRSSVEIDCPVTGPAPIPGVVPEVVWRMGIDRDPLDVRDADATAWLLSLVWADHPHRRRRLEAAIRLAQADPPAVRRGDLLDDLGPVLAEAPADARLVVFHTAVRPYVPAERWEDLNGALSEHSRQRDVTLVTFEGDGRTRLVEGAAGPHAFLLERITFSAGSARTERLGKGHPHGGMVHWAG
jgi:hypothetical protein